MIGHIAMRNIKSYRVIALPLLGAVHHYIYLKEHHDTQSPDESNPEYQQGHVLFVGNITFSYQMNELLNESILQDILKLLFQDFGEITSISISRFNEASNTLEKSRFAHVKFAKKKYLRNALTSNDEVYEAIGRRLSSQFNLFSNFNLKSSKDIVSSQPLFYDVNPDELKESISEFMKDFEEKEEIKLLNAMKGPDDDGFIMVKPRYASYIILQSVNILIAINSGINELLKQFLHQ